MSRKDHSGLLDGSYAQARRRNPVVSFRYRLRVLTAVSLAQTHLSQESPLRILDLGSAEGLALLEFDGLLDCAELVGVELSPDLVEIARSMEGTFRIVEGDIAVLPEGVGEAPYDVVTALAVLEHVPDVASVVREAARVLRPGGLFIATCPSPRWESISTTLGLMSDESHAHHLDRPALECLIEQSGLRLEEFRPFMFAPIGFLPYVRLPVSPRFALRLDRTARSLRVFNWLFVNQAIVARKPPV